MYAVTFAGLYWDGKQFVGGIGRARRYHLRHGERPDVPECFRPFVKVKFL